MLKSRQAHTPVLSIYMGDGSPITGLDEISDGDVILYRCAHHAVPAAPRSSAAAAAQQSFVSGMSTPRETSAHSFVVTVHRLGRAGAASGAASGAIVASTSSSADAVAQVMMEEAAGAAGHSIRVPATGLESMSLPSLCHRIKLAAKLSLTADITKLFLPSGMALH